MGNYLNLSRPITCKECNKSFSNIQLHLYNSAVCKKNYSTEQLNTLKKFSNEKKEAYSNLISQVSLPPITLELVHLNEGLKQVIQNLL